ncbi:MAG: HAMP domain-containing sensor histidine kinase [Actinomycetota bacterium]
MAAEATPSTRVRPEARPKQRLAVQLWQMLILVITLLWLGIGLPQYPDEILTGAVILFIAIVIAVDLIPVPAWGGMQLSLSFPIQLAVAMSFPVPIAGLIAFVGSVDPREFRREVSILKALYNRGQIALSILLGAAVFHAMTSLNAKWYELLPGLLAATIVAYAANTLIVAVQASLESRVPLWQVLAKMHGARPVEFLFSYLGLGLFGVVIARFYESEGVWSVLVFLAPLVFARQMYFRSRALADQLAEQNQLLAEQASRLEELLVKETETSNELRELNRMKGEFVAVVSHELRTPVTALIGYAKTLQQREFAEDEVLRQEFLERMERQGDRLLRLVENLLTASRLESRELPVQVQRVLFEDVCREVVEGLGEASRVVVDVPSDLPVLHTDRQLLGRVVQNLLDNALKYSPDGEPCELGARADNDTVMFWVRDHGVGIPQDKVERIFERFYQVDSSSTRIFRGAGLGLSLVADLLEHLGGRIEVDSAPDEGSTFTVHVPVHHPGTAEGQDPQEHGDLSSAVG